MVVEVKIEAEACLRINTEGYIDVNEVRNGREGTMGCDDERVTNEKRRSFNPEGQARWGLVEWGERATG